MSNAVRGAPARVALARALAGPGYQTKPRPRRLPHLGHRRRVEHLNRERRAVRPHERLQIEIRRDAALD
jgi:hypothetical protein